MTIGITHMKCSEDSCRKTRMGIFRENDINKLENQVKLCEVCNNIANTKNSSNTFNSVSLRYKKLQLDQGAKPIAVAGLVKR